MTDDIEAMPDEWECETCHVHVANVNTLDALREHVRRLREALAFAASAIKSGEGWTPTCEAIITAALRSET